MKVILTEDVEKVGKAGEVVRVADGYGRNYLIPRKLAVPADPRNLKRLEHERRAIAARARRAREAASALAEKLATLRLAIPARAGEEGKLFGAVTSRDIADALAAAGVPVDRKAILLSDPLKQVGDYRVKVRLGGGLAPEVAVSVVAAE